MNRHEPKQNIEHVLMHRFPAQAKALRKTRSKVRTALTLWGCGPDRVDEVVIAIDEACQNIIRHAYGQETKEAIVLQIQHQEHGLVITLRDYAPPVRADCMKPRDLDNVRPGGLGCHFIQQVMEEVAVESAPEGKGNILRMVKRLSSSI